ncbi:MAG: Ig-like domain-containing protein [Gemmatimonadaceae bacterium]|nr:Ig-like domain-containing protein [Gemmatimonadaceae bacterium]
MPSSRLAIAAAAIVLTACGGERASAPPPVARESLAIHLPDGEWYPGDEIALSAVVRDADGELIPNAPVTWSVSSDAHAVLGANGVATLLQSGPVTFTARYGNIIESEALTVRPLSVTQVTVLPSTLQLQVGEASPLGLRVQGAGGRDVLGRIVTLSSDDPTIAFMDAAGRVHAVAPGVTTVRAIADGVPGTARVEVAREPPVCRCHAWMAGASPCWWPPTP